MKQHFLTTIALLAGLFSAAAGSTYTPNIAGFVRVSLNSNLTLVSNPFEVGFTNGANEVLPALADGTGLLTWETSAGSYNHLLVSQGTYFNADSGNPAPAPVLAPGEGFFIAQPGVVTNLTFVGAVALARGTTNYTSFPQGYSLTGAKLPITGRLTTDLHLQIPSTAIVQFYLDGAYSQYSCNAGIWYDASTQAVVSEPVLQAGQGFFLFNQASAPILWPQYLPK